MFVTGLVIQIKREWSLAGRGGRCLAKELGGRWLLEQITYEGRRVPTNTMVPPSMSGEDVTADGWEAAIAYQASLSSHVGLVASRKRSSSRTRMR